MTNQQFYQQNFDNRPAVEIPPSQRIYAFKDLPPEVQENLLRLQNADGEFLRVRYVSTYTSGALLIYLSIGFVLFLADFLLFLNDFKNVVFDLKWIIVFSGGALAFALCYLYLLRGFFRGRRAPIKTGIYLTLTQVIETFDGLVRYRELKDAAEISVNRYWNDSGHRSSLDIKFADGDIYQYKMEVISNSIQLSETKKWQETAADWRNEAISAAKRGNAAYFESRDVFQEPALINTPVLERTSRQLSLRILLVITFALLVSSVLAYFSIK